MALWLVVHRPNDGCPAEGQPPSAPRIAILKGKDAEEALRQAVHLAYPGDGHGHSAGVRPRDWTRHQELAEERRRREFEAVPVGERGRFVEL